MNISIDEDVIMVLKRKLVEIMIPIVLEELRKYVTVAGWGQDPLLEFVKRLCSQ